MKAKKHYKEYTTSVNINIVFVEISHNIQTCGNHSHTKQHHRFSTKAISANSGIELGTEKSKKTN